MKAKEYAQTYREKIAAKTDVLEAAGWLAVSLIQEFVDTGKQRNCESDEAFLAVWLEMLQKWKRIATMLPEAKLRADGLDIFMRSFNPELWRALEATRKRLGK